jgi:uncharacterized membrane protein
VKCATPLIQSVRKPPAKNANTDSQALRCADGASIQSAVACRAMHPNTAALDRSGRVKTAIVHSFLVPHQNCARRVFRIYGVTQTAFTPHAIKCSIFVRGEDAVHSRAMTKARLETFTDGVIAILITIMVLELRVPHGVGWAALGPLVPVFLTYLLSFVYLAIYWNNHHHMFHTVDHVNGKVMWANMHLLFWLSMVPFVTGWMGENRFATIPTAAYGCVMLLSAIAYTILQQVIIAYQGPHSKLAAAVGGDRKGKISAALYAIAIPMAFFSRAASGAIYVTVALIWLMPDRRIETRLESEAHHGR